MTKPKIFVVVLALAATAAPALAAEAPEEPRIPFAAHGIPTGGGEKAA